MEEKRTLKRNKMKFSDWTAGSHVIGGQPIGTGPDETSRISTGNKTFPSLTAAGSKIEKYCHDELCK
jgi:hypothetical protein